MLSNHKIFIDIQEVNGDFHVATLDKSKPLFGIFENFEVFGGDKMSVVNIITKKLDRYQFCGANILFILDEKELIKIQAIRQTPLASDLEGFIEKYPGRINFIANWSLVGYKVFGDTTHIKNGASISFVNGKNSEFNLEIAYPFANGVFQIVNGGPEVGHIALSKIGREFENNSYGYTTVVDCLMKGHKPTVDYSLNVEIARLSFKNYLNAHGEQLLNAIG